MARSTALSHPVLHRRELSAQQTKIIPTEASYMDYISSGVNLQTDAMVTREQTRYKQENETAVPEQAHKNNSNTLKRGTQIHNSPDPNVHGLHAAAV